MGFGLLLIIIIAFLLLFDGGAILKRLFDSENTSKSKSASAPREILDARLARGEIDVVEYKNIRKNLDETEVIQ